MINDVENQPTEEKICGLCHHSLKDNDHGLDQNDMWLEGDKLVHSGHCTYCEMCNPRLRGVKINTRYGHAWDCKFGLENSGFCSCGKGFKK